MVFAHRSGCKDRLDAFTTICASIDRCLGHIDDDQPRNVTLDKDQHEFGDVASGCFLLADQIDESALTAFQLRLFRAAEALIRALSRCWGLTATHWVICDLRRQRSAPSIAETPDLEILSWCDGT